MMDVFTLTSIVMDSGYEEVQNKQNWIRTLCLVKTGYFYLNMGSKLVIPETGYGGDLVENYCAAL
jgi:hypothetical protein